ncbi:beta-lactamase family protein [Massilia sp. PAMC28688]|uniref:serine hydrolase domain-containing protein n=1 Tax=Massilia sp. PAMC28688 TaxID=2861283 RepID=UPI001C633EC6|nr:serine hydrolase domain-containing protein [Massilia sp. PAMC28688]QYF93224.1 beta-lactamase family protein [Massilia sp. PAMC28688]
MPTSRTQVTIAAFLYGFASLANASSDSLALQQGVDQIFAEFAKPGAPGCAVGVIRDGKLIYEKGYGLANLEHDVPIDPQQTVFNIGSTSKQFTAAAVLLLVSEGKLSLDDDVRTWLPEIPAYVQVITVRDLLQHTSGLRDNTVLMTMGTGILESDYRSADEGMALISKQKALNFAPGTHFMYSNTNYFLLARIVAKVSQRPFGEFMKERIFAPVGMHQTRIGEHFDEIVPHLASAYKKSASEGFSLSMNNWEHVGESRVLSTIGDLAKWDRNFYVPVVGNTSVFTQMQKKSRRRDGVELNYAQGLFVDRFGGQTLIHHGGNTAGYASQLLRLPDLHFSVAVLCNNSYNGVDNLARRVSHLYLADKLDFTQRPAVATRTAAISAGANRPDTARIAGTYVERFDQSIRRIEISDGKLWYVRNEKSRSELSSNERGFDVEGSSAFLSFPVPGKQMRFHPVNGEPSEFTKVVPVSSRDVERQAYLGTYTSQEIGATWTVVLKDGELAIQTVRAADTPMIPVFQDGFRAGTELIRFMRDKTGRVTGLSADNIRVLGLKFDKTSGGAQPSGRQGR